MRSGDNIVASWTGLPLQGPATGPASGLGLGSSLARGAAGSLGLHVVSTALALVTALILAAFLGAGDYGVYSLAMVYANILGLVACLGFPQLMVRHVARHSAAGRWGDLANLARTAALCSIVAAMTIALGGWVVLPWFVGELERGHQTIFLFSMLLVVPIAVQRLGETMLLGFDRPAASLVPERLVRPVVMLGLVLILALEGATLAGPEMAMAAQVVAYTVSVAGAAWLLMKASPYAWWREQARFEGGLLKESLPLLLAGLMTVLSTRIDVMMLGAMADVEATGQYRLASQLAALPLMIATTAQAIVSPHIARCHAEGRLSDLWPMLIRIAGGAAASAIAVGLFVIAGFDVLLPLIGSSFAGSAVPLVILTAAYALMAVLYFALPLLTMTGHTRDVVVANAAAIACNIVLNLILVPRYGAEGAAVATLVSFALLYGLLLWNARRRLGPFWR